VERPDRDEITAQLDRMSPGERLEAIRSLGGGRAQGRLWAAAADAPVVTLDDLVPPDMPPLREVIWHGKNSLPAFTHFQKRFCRPMPGPASDQLWGYNHTSIAWLVGPGYFVVHKEGDAPAVSTTASAAVPSGELAGHQTTTSGHVLRLPRHGGLPAPHLAARHDQSGHPCGAELPATSSSAARVGGSEGEDPGGPGLGKMRERSGRFQLTRAASLHELSMRSYAALVVGVHGSASLCSRTTSAACIATGLRRGDRHPGTRP
jgi:hypothetical protein